MNDYFAIDIGGTSVKLGIVDETGTVRTKAEESVNFDGYQTPVLTTVLRAAKKFLTEQGKKPEDLAGIGVSATGQIDSKTLHRQPHQSRAGSSIRPAGHRCQRCKLYVFGRGLGRRC